MNYSKTQGQVLSKMIVIGLFCVFLYVLGVWYDPFYFPEGLDFVSRCESFFPYLLCLSIPLLVAIMRVARYRFLHKNVIDAAEQSHNKVDKNLSVLQSLLTNTLEQVVLALCVYLCWLALAPSEDLSVICLSALAFLFGRVLFFIGYKYGAGARSLGFILTFYPQVLLILHMLVVYVLLPFCFNTLY